MTRLQHGGLIVGIGDTAGVSHKGTPGATGEICSAWYGAKPQRGDRRLPDGEGLAV